MKPQGPEEPAVFPTKVTANEVRERGVLVDTPKGRLALIVDTGIEECDASSLFSPGSMGKIVAIDAWCPHIDGPLWEGSSHGGEIACPWHRWRYSLSTGKCTWAPAGDAEEAAETEIQVFRTQEAADGTLEILIGAQ